MDFAERVRIKRAERETQAAAEDQAARAEAAAGEAIMPPYADALSAAAQEMAQSSRFRSVFGEEPPRVISASFGDTLQVHLDVDLSTVTAREANVTLVTGGNNYTREDFVLAVRLTPGNDPDHVTMQVAVLEDEEGIPDRFRTFNTASNESIQVSSPQEMKDRLDDIVAGFVARYAQGPETGPRTEAEPAQEASGLMAREGFMSRFMRR